MDTSTDDFVDGTGDDNINTLPSNFNDFNEQDLVLGVGAAVLLAAPSGFGEWKPAVLVGLGCLCWGVDNNLTAIIDGYTPAQTTCAKGLVAGSVNLALGLGGLDLTQGDVEGCRGRSRSTTRLFCSTWR